MKKILLCNIFAVALILSSCSTYQYTSRQTNIDRMNVTMAPTIVDVRPDYAKRIEVISNWCKTEKEALEKAIESNFNRFCWILC